MKENIVIWGAGRYLASLKRYIDWDEIVCIVDGDSSKWGENIEGKEIVSPTDLSKVNFDKVAVFVASCFDEICLRLTKELEVSPEKILHWSDYIKHYSVQQTMEQVMKDAYHKGCICLLDYKNTFWKNHVYVYSNDKITIEVPDYKEDYALGGKSYMLLETPGSKMQSAVFLGRVSEFTRLDWENWSSQYKAIYFTVAYSAVPFAEQYLSCFQSDEVVWERFDLSYERLYCISERKPDKELKIFIAAHKAFVPPQKEEYIPLWLGKTEDNIWGYQEDKDRPNISRLNSLINECTGLFWIWKHAEADYVGLVHYRRYFLNDKEADIENILCKENAMRLLEEYDMITAPLMFFPHSVANQLEETTNSDAYEQGVRIMEEVIAKKQPEYLAAFRYVFAGKTMFPCNMMLTSKKLFDRYSEWLFSIIIEAAEMVDVSAYDTYSQRIVGFMAERLFTVWLIKQELRIKELPILLAE